MDGIRFIVLAAVSTPLAFAIGDKVGMAWEAAGAGIMTLAGIEAAGEVPVHLARGLVADPLALSAAPLQIGRAHV